MPREMASVFETNPKVYLYMVHSQSPGPDRRTKKVFIAAYWLHFTKPVPTSIHYRLLMYKLLFIMTPRFPYCNYHEYTRWLMHILADQSPETYAMITRGVH